MQRNWIGRSEGTLVDFKLDAATDSPESTITVFTTRVDTIYGATSVQLAPEHPLVARLTRNDDPLRTQVEQLIAEQRKAKEVGDIGSIEKHGVNTHHFAVNPFNGERVPIWIANYILMDYGTGAIMSVPAHDDRDFEFARKYGLKIRLVVVPRSIDPEETSVEPTLPFSTMNGRLVNSGPFNGLDCEEAIPKMSAFAEKNGFGKATVTYRLKDWGISRQRYWGTPIPMLYCEKDGIVPVPEKDLPVILPENVDITLTGGSPLGQVPEFVNVICPNQRGRLTRTGGACDKNQAARFVQKRLNGVQRQANLLQSQQSGGNLPQHQAKLALLLENTDAESGCVAEGKPEIRPALFAHVLDVVFRSDAAHQFLGVLRPQGRAVHTVQHAMYADHRGHADADVEVRRSFGHHQLQQI
jgi:hypothetical protein